MCCKPGSREALEKILVTHAGRINIPGIPLRELTDQLMDWATGQRERGWCEHIIWHDECPRGWVYRPSLHSPELWHFCPSCGTPRPGEG